jgi:glycosyltransferase involved in cell wall biosynthesis
MRVGVDARHLAADRGVAHHTRSLLTALAAAWPDDEWRLFVPGRQPVRAPSGPNVVLVRDGRPSRVLFGAAALAGRPRLDRLLGGGLDVVWVPAPAPVALSAGVPYVVTVHDRSWEERPEDFTAYERLWHRLARPAAQARGAARVVAVSRATAASVTSAWGLDPARVRVAHPGVTAGPAVAGVLPRGLPERFLLFVGALEPRKAPDVLAAAYARARAEGLDAGLVVVGAGRARAALDGLPDTVVLDAGVDRPVLDALYAAAEAVVAPSWLEGFGFVPLEAAAHGTPAVLSALDAFAETLGDAALLVPPGDVAGFAAAMRLVVGDGELRDRLGGAARERAARFVWDATAEATRAALAEAAGA